MSDAFLAKSQVEIKKNDWRVDESSIKKLDASKWKPESQVDVKKVRMADVKRACRLTCISRQN